MYDAYSTCGFAIYTNVYNQWLSEINDFKKLVHEFFDLPIEIKKQYEYSGVKENVGYHWVGSEYLEPNKPADLKESYNWAGSAKMLENRWPKEIPEFKPLAQKILRIAQLLSHDFLYKFEEMFNLPRGKLVEQNMDYNSVMRIIHYPAWKKEIKEDQIRLNEHTDYGTITLLWQLDDCPGLQLYNRKAENWVDVPVIENSLILNIADLFQRWTNGVIKSVPHRVVNTDMTKSRYSMPYFVHPECNVIVKNITQQIDEYPPIDAEKYHMWRLTNAYKTENRNDEKAFDWGKK
jgi:isopenicillin N synthase-like dioxygenase